MAETVYLLCAATSVLCTVLLLRGYLRTRSRLLFWSAICFVGLAVNNALLVLDRIVVPTQDLSTIRLLPAALGFTALLYGLIWDAK